VLVSHDRALIDAVATRTLLLGEGRPIAAAGGWTDLRAARHRPVAPMPAPAPAPRPVGRDQHEQARRRARDAERRTRRFRELEGLIAKAEERQKTLRDALARGGLDWEELDRLAREERELSRRLEEMIHEWAELGSQV
jgi:ATPase subunit of ABC transporter with duplicated ATPase domains